MAIRSFAKTSKFSFNHRSALAEANGAFEPIVGLKEKIEEISKKLEDFWCVADILSCLSEVVERSYSLQQLGDNLQAHYLGGYWENSIYRDFPLQICVDWLHSHYDPDDLVNQRQYDRYYHSAAMRRFHKMMWKYDYYQSEWDPINDSRMFFFHCSSFKKNFNLIVETFKNSGLTLGESWYMKNMSPYESTEDTSWLWVKEQYKVLLKDVHRKRPLP